MVKFLRLKTTFPYIFVRACFIIVAFGEEFLSFFRLLEQLHNLPLSFLQGLPSASSLPSLLNSWLCWWFIHEYELHVNLYVCMFSGLAIYI